MVSTRHHPSEFPEPDLTPNSTPSKSTRSTSTAVAKTPSKSPKATSLGGYVHTPDPIVIVWMLVSLPLVIWDTLYVLGRPHTMPGGKFHSPLWKPYALYGTVDYIYGWPAWNSNNGFTAAQGSLNAIETVIYLFYLWVVFANGRVTKAQGGKKSVKWFVLDEKKVDAAGIAVLAVFACAVMTLSKTLLYWLNEAFSGFDNIGHNTFTSLVPLWIIPNGAWIVFPSYMIYVLGAEIVSALDAAGAKKSK